eukprot:6767891-Pyramimonas_sp.AAC.1
MITTGEFDLRGDSGYRRLSRDASDRLMSMASLASTSSRVDTPKHTHLAEKRLSIDCRHVPAIQLRP